MSVPGRGLSFLLLSMAALACGAGGAAEKARPADPTYAGASGSQSCLAVENYGEPLIVDWRPELRGDLEIEMRQGLAVVAYDCHTLRLLKDCDLSGSYAFVSMSKKEQVIRLDNADEIRANLPLRGPALAVQLEGDLARGTTLDVALVMIGKRATTRRAVARNELRGRCDGATHFVRRATLGAFAMETGARATTHTAAQLFGAGGKDDSSSQKHVRNTDGTLTSCDGVGADATTPPAGCSALLRLELSAVDTPAAPHDAETPAAEPPVSTCPKGLVMREGKCAAPIPNSDRENCGRGQLDGCTAECDRGVVTGCRALGFAYMSGKGTTRDETRAADFFRRGCEGGDEYACSTLGFLYGHAKTLAPDFALAASFYRRGCDGGEPFGCYFLGLSYKNGRGVPQDAARGVDLFRRSCEGQYAWGCIYLGGAYEEGAGIPADDARARELFTRACPRAAYGCTRLASLYEKGKGVPADRARAVELYRKACGQKEEHACSALKRLNESP